VRRADLVRASGIVAALVVVWVFAWGDLSVANVLSGVAVGLLLLTTFPVGRLPDRGGRTLRLLPALRLVGVFLVNLVASNVAMARDILDGGRRIETGVVACPLRVDSDGIATFLTNVLTLSPGTLPLEVDHDPPVLYVHVLHMADRERIIATVRRLEELAVATYGNAAERSACEVVRA
jgi:multicomponent Na+:H+ antiporter subunit E